MVISENTSANTHETVFQLLQETRVSGRILDIPCGEGAFTQRVLTSEREVDSADVVDLLKVNHKNFHQSDMNQKLPQPDETYSAVVCIDGIEHIERSFDFVKECHRVLKDGGYLLISTPNISAIRSRVRWLLTGFHNKCKSPLDETNPNPLHHIAMISLPEIRYMLHTNGFILEKITTNRVKAISLLYLPLVPLCWLVTKLTFAKELKAPSEKRIGQQLFGELFRWPVLFGETLIVRARKVKRAQQLH